MNVDGGTAPYTYLWSNGSIQKDLVGIGEGVYYVNILDAKGCLRKDTVSISQPDLLTASLYSSIMPNGSNISFYQGTDGSIDLTVLGGTKPYAYVWSNGETTEDIYNLSAGAYSVIITDQNGCRTSADTILTGPSELAMPTGITPNGDGNNDFFVVKGIEAYTNNTLTIYNRWGNVVFQVDNYSNLWGGFNSSGEELPEGTYFAFLELHGASIELKGYVEIRRK